jgi:hypothetical protein
MAPSGSFRFADYPAGGHERSSWSNHMAEFPTRWQLIRDLLVFQVKLAADALRDLILSPVSLAAGAIDLLRGGGRPGQRFYEVLLAGRRSEEVIDLFGAADRVAPRDGEAPRHGPASIDAVVARLERVLVEQVERGGVTASAKAAIDRSLDALGTGRRSPPPPSQPDPSPGAPRD